MAGALPGPSKSWNLSQERIVFALAVLLFVVAAVSLRGFLATNNLISIVRSVSVLGILAVGMAIVIIGRGIDLSAVAIMAMSAAWYLQMLNDGYSDSAALGLVIGGSLLIGLINGYLIAYADVPAIFATLASGAFVFGSVRSQLITPGRGSGAARPLAARRSGREAVLDVPAEIFIFAGLAFLVFLFLRFTKWGRYVYYHGRQFRRRPQHGHSRPADDLCCAMRSRR